MATPLPQQRTNGSTPHAAPRSVMALRTQKGIVEHAKWFHVYGSEGVGKTTFGASAPGALFIDIEQGSQNIECERFLFDDKGRTRPESFDEFLEALRVIERECAPGRTLVIDTLDALEALIWAHICQRDGKTGIIDYGFAKGENYVAVDEWRRVIALFERIRVKGISIITLSHAESKRRDDPDGEGWDRYILKLHIKAAGLVKERADGVLFARREVSRVKREGRLVGVDSERRILCCNWDPKYDAKNRSDLPDTLALEWSELAAAVAAHRPNDPAKLVESIKRDAKRIGGEIEKTALACIAADGADAVKMTKVRTWLTTKLAEAGVTEEN